MRRVSILIAVIALVVGVITLSPHATSRAQDGTPTAEQQDIAGSWIITATITSEDDAGYSFVNFSTFMPGGGLVTTAPDSPLGHGAWELRGDGTYAATMIWPDFDDDDGALEGQSTVRVTITLGPDGTTFTGPFLNEFTDDTGEVLFSAEGTAQGQRILVDALGTPQAGSPESATPAA